jgi:selenocysteine lyase/cysteine desulfurase
MSANAAVPGAYDAERVWRDFPILRREVHGKSLVFLDSAASSQRPASVVAAVDRSVLAESIFFGDGNTNPSTSLFFGLGYRFTGGF